MRALWTSASGLNAQQSRLDTIANNLANLNTTGYKSQDVQFKDILYAQYAQKPEVGQINDPLQPRQSTMGLRIGQGVFAAGMMQSFAQGSLQQTSNATDLAIEGQGFFQVQVPSGNGSTQVAYTRDGSFKVSNFSTIPKDPNPTMELTDSAGHPVLDAQGNPINLTGHDITTLKVGTDGTVTAKQTGSGTIDTLGQIDLVNIANPETNLASAGNNLYALNSNANPNVVTHSAYATGHIRQGYIEQSNVDMSSMMTEMMQAQRIYGMDSKAMTTTDQMMGMANNLRG